MTTYSFRETRTGKTRLIGGADDAVTALKALTIYPWAFELVATGLGGTATEPCSTADIEAVKAYAEAERITAYARAEEA